MVAEHIRPTVHESDTETVPSVAGSGEVTDDDGLSDVNDMEHPSLGEVMVGLEEISASATTRAAMATLDAVDLSEVFSVRARTLKCPPAFLKGAFRSCLRIALQEAECGRAESNEVRRVRAWKLFLLLPRMLLFCSGRGGMIPKKKLQERFLLFAQGEWLKLLRLSHEVAQSRARGSRRIRQNQVDSVERRAERAQALAQLGELSSARQALEGSCVAPGNLATLRSLTNPSRRPARPRDPLPDSVVEHRATSTFALDAERFLSNLRCSKKGAAGGWSGMTCEHLRPLLERPSDSELLCNLAQELAEASTPASVVDMHRRGRITALQKPNGGVRGITVGEVFRRLVARTIAQQLAPAVQEATAPFQYALTTRSGCECVAHAVQALIDVDGRATILSIDGIGAFDLVSRGAMLEGLRTLDGGDAALEGLVVRPAGTSGKTKRV